MSVRRIVPNLPADATGEGRAFYGDFLGLQTAMDLGWIVTFASPAHPAAQLSLITTDATAPLRPDLTVELDDPDELNALHAEAVRRGLDLPYPLTDEPWGVRRFFVRDPGGRVVNVMAHPRRG